MSEKVMNCNYGNYSASPGNAIKSPTGTFRTQKISYSTDANAAWLYPETQLCDLEPSPSRLNLESGALFREVSTSMRPASVLPSVPRDSGDLLSKSLFQFVREHQLLY